MAAGWLPPRLLCVPFVPPRMWQSLEVNQHPWNQGSSEISKNHRCLKAWSCHCTSDNTTGHRVWPGRSKQQNSNNKIPQIFHILIGTDIPAGLSGRSKFVFGIMDLSRDKNGLRTGRVGIKTSVNFSVSTLSSNSKNYLDEPGSFYQIPSSIPTY